MGSLENATARHGGAVAILAGLFFGSPASAREWPQTGRLATAVRDGSIRFQLSSGRVVLKVVRQIPFSPRFASGTHRERLMTGPPTTDATLRYDLTTPDEEVSIHFTSAKRMEIRRFPKGDSNVTPVEFSQPATGPICLKVGANGAREYRAATLWHLMLAEPAECRESLLPLFRLLQPNWDLAKTSDGVRAVLLRMAEDGAGPNEKQWAQWVQQLGDDQFAVRDAADRQLRGVGRAVAGYLQQLDATGLDAEQRYRIRRIINALTSANGNDSPEQIACSVFADSAVWLPMLSSPDESTRKTAARRLGVIRGRPVAFDPTADLETRRKQIETLRAKKG